MTLCLLLLLLASVSARAGGQPLACSAEDAGSGFCSSGCALPFLTWRDVAHLLALPRSLSAPERCGVARLVAVLLGEHADAAQLPRSAVSVQGLGVTCVCVATASARQKAVSLPAAYGASVVVVATSSEDEYRTLCVQDCAALLPADGCAGRDYVLLLEPGSAVALTSGALLPEGSRAGVDAARKQAAASALDRMLARREASYALAEAALLLRLDLAWQYSAADGAGVWKSNEATAAKEPLGKSPEFGISVEADARPFVSTRLHSGLGNQLFQLARAFGFAELHGGVPGVWVLGAELNPHSQRAGTNYFRTIFAKLTRVYLPPDFISEEPAGAANAYLPGPFFEPHLRHVHFKGYFQHERYFPRDWRAFLSALQLPTVPPMARTAFIHVRRGDYVGCPQHDVGLVENGYYEAAIALIREHHGGDGAVRFLVFSDDIEWTRASTLFAGPDFDFSDETDEVAALMAMAACMLGGVAANSSFSWWGAFLIENANKTVVFPDRWYTESSGLASDSQFSGSYVVHVGAGNAVHRKGTAADR